MSLPKSIKIGYAIFFDHIPTPELLRAHSAQLFDWIAEGKLKDQHRRRLSAGRCGQGACRHVAKRMPLLLILLRA